MANNNTDRWQPLLQVPIKQADIVVQRLLRHPRHLLLLLDENGGPWAPEPYCQTTTTMNQEDWDKDNSFWGGIVNEIHHSGDT